jgi:GntR family transcriptional regulator
MSDTINDLEPVEPPTPRRGPAGQPRWLEIQTELAADVKAGRVSIGSLLPTEHELCARFGASRFTVRQALKGLQEAGLIERRSGVGSLVVASEPREAFVHSLTSMSELLRYPAETSRVELSRQTIRASAEQAHLLLCNAGEEWVRLQGVRIARGSKLPFSFADIFVRPGYAAIFDLPNPTGEPAFRQIETHFGLRIGHARVEIFAGQITDDLAGPMQIEAGTPALIMIRRYTGPDGKIFLVTYTVHPANRFVFTMDLERRREPA